MHRTRYLRAQQQQHSPTDHKIIRWGLQVSELSYNDFPAFWSITH